MRPAVYAVIGVANLFLSALWLMLLAGAVHGVDHVVPTLSYWSSFLLAFLYGAFHNSATWPGPGHKVEDL